MIRKVVRQIAFVLCLAWLTGPILTKELRVSGRRRRHYVLRSAYVLLMLAFVAGAWLTFVPWEKHHSPLRVLIKTPEAGMWIVVTLVWFQFSAAGLMGIILPSNAVSDEIYHRTLGVLMTTPITALQIVMGKMLAKLSQVLLLLAMSVPVLLLVQGFGGVPWEFVACGLCLTVSTVLLFASISVFYSIFTRHSYLVILATILTGGVLFIGLPFAVGWFMAEPLDMREQTVISFLSAVNPIVALAIETEEMSWGGGLQVYWGVCSVFLTAVSAGILAACVALVRRAAIRQLIGGSSDDVEPVIVTAPLVAAPVGAVRAAALLPPIPAASAAGVGAAPPPGPPASGGTAEPPPLPPSAPPGPPELPTFLGLVVAPRQPRVRRVSGWPTLWREVRLPMIRKRLWRILIPSITMAILLFTYVIVAVENELDDEEAHIAYLMIFFILGVLATLTASAGCITSEKESRSWPLLLMTSVSYPAIILGKAAGVARRVLPVWSLVAWHLLVFTLVGFVHPIVWVHMAIVATYLIVFLIGTGMYFSAMFRRTTTAVVMNLLLALVVFAGIPMVGGLVAEITHNYDSVVFDAMMRYHPGAHVALSADAHTGDNAQRPIDNVTYDMPRGRLYPADFMWLLLKAAALYGLAGVGFMALSTLHYRRHLG